MQYGIQVEKLLQAVVSMVLCGISPACTLSNNTAHASVRYI